MHSLLNLLTPLQGVLGIFYGISVRKIVLLHMSFQENVSYHQVQDGALYRGQCKEYSRRKTYRLRRRKRSGIIAAVRPRVRERNLRSAESTQ